LSIWILGRSGSAGIKKVEKEEVLGEGGSILKKSKEGLVVSICKSIGRRW
jgi:hypothetical protein